MCSPGSPPEELFATSMFSSIFISTDLSWKKNQGRDGASYFGSRTTSAFFFFFFFFPKVSSMLKGRILVWCYMDAGGGVWLQMRLHLPQLQGCSEQVSGLGSINSVLIHTPFCRKQWYKTHSYNLFGEFVKVRTSGTSSAYFIDICLLKISVQQTIFSASVS